MLNPWVFGDEYIYLSKARNLRFGLDVISDASLGHKYPPIYSYLLTLGITHNSETTYRNVQLINFLVAQVFLLVSFFILNKAFSFSKNKEGKFFLILFYLAISSSQMLTGFHFVAMSENLYSPLLILIFSLIIFTYKKNKFNFKLFSLISFLSGVAILTRAIGLTLIPTLIITMLVTTWKGWEIYLNKNYVIIHGFVNILLVILFTLGLPKLFTLWESSMVKNLDQAVSHQSYSANPYLSVFINFFQGKHHLFNTIKLIGNHFIYLLISSFFIPIFFFGHKIIYTVTEFFKNKKKPAINLIFLLSFTFFSFVLSYLHCYLGFKSNPIKYSTYFRYFDTSILLIILYGWLQAWNFYQERKARVNKKWLSVFTVVAVLIVLILPPRTFYVTINSLGWGWLDLLQNYQWLNKIFVILAILIFSLTINKNKKLLFFWISIIIVINLLTLKVSLGMHRWQAGFYRDNLDNILEELIAERKITDFYINESSLQKINLSYVYYFKYKLQFITTKIVPVTILGQEDKEKILNKPYVLISEQSSLDQLRQEQPELIKISDDFNVKIFP